MTAADFAALIQSQQWEHSISSTITGTSTPSAKSLPLPLARETQEQREQKEQKEQPVDWSTV